MEYTTNTYDELDNSIPIGYYLTITYNTLGSRIKKHQTSSKFILKIIN